jgi:hypothetical protein
MTTSITVQNVVSVTPKLITPDSGSAFGVLDFVCSDGARTTVIFDSFATCLAMALAYEGAKAVAQ